MIDWINERFVRAVRGLECWASTSRGEGSGFTKAMARRGSVGAPVEKSMSSLKVRSYRNKGSREDEAVGFSVPRSAVANRALSAMPMDIAKSERTPRPYGGDSNDKLLELIVQLFLRLLNFQFVENSASSTRAVPVSAVL
ncbi:hypothetical protein VFPPC_16175 [Pochonia chlamydosporia 170]|uniref:Uncharacterized protein n=1 Tax=Pochonia chlamydosporia 170 TaxID=1380566 RepID=A0A179FF86_METCM|nr:hypothetical protein VFPPC_16175 [Pochonia chlamydosporia 170]OAQ64186.1 hypothetical protein VFPPC_16175 [Pochonia chlamydosporia 170]